MKIKKEENEEGLRRFLIMKKHKIIILLSSILVGSLIVIACGDIDVAEKASPVWVEIVGIEYTGESDAETGDIALIDVCDLQGTEETGFNCSYVDEFVDVSFLTHSVDPDGVGGSSTWMDVHIEHYRVSFFRTDGGSNVPGTFDIYCDLYCPYESIATYECKLLHADQKLDPPLIWLNCLESFCYDPETGKPIIKGFAVLQFWGKDNAGKNVYAETQIEVQFADWAD